MERKKGMVGVRTRTAKNPEKALRQYEEMRAAGGVRQAMVIVEGKDRNLTLLGQGNTVPMLFGLLRMAVEALKHMPLPDITRAVREGREVPLSVGERVGPKLTQQEITIADDGTLQAPAGETMISCGECRHPRWHITMNEATQLPGRFSCAHCGNEVVWRRAQHTHPAPEARQ
jgi:hypothetical protein